MATIVVVAFESVDETSLRGPMEVWSTANEVVRRRRPGSRDVFDVQVASDSPGAPTTSADLVALEEQLDVVWVPHCHAAAVPTESQVEVLKHLRDIAEVMVGAGAGCIALAAAGLVSGLVAVEGEIAERLERLSVNVEVDPDATYVDQGPLLTSPASRSVDAALRVVARQSGARLADQVASHLGLEWFPAHGRVLPPPSGDGLF